MIFIIFIYLFISLFIYLFTYLLIYLLTYLLKIVIILIDLSFASTRFIYCHLYINQYMNCIIYALTNI